MSHPNIEISVNVIRYMNILASAVLIISMGLAGYVKLISEISPILLKLGNYFSLHFWSKDVLKLNVIIFTLFLLLFSITKSIYPKNTHFIYADFSKKLDMPTISYWFIRSGSNFKNTSADWNWNFGPIYCNDAVFRRRGILFKICTFRLLLKGVKLFLLFSFVLAFTLTWHAATRRWCFPTIRPFVWTSKVRLCIYINRSFISKSIIWSFWGFQTFSIIFFSIIFQKKRFLKLRA